MATLVGLENYARAWLEENAGDLLFLPDEDDVQRFDAFVRELFVELDVAIADRLIEWREAHEAQMAAPSNAESYHHADPCGDESCPCRKAEADDWRDHGAMRH